MVDARFLRKSSKRCFEDLKIDREQKRQIMQIKRIWGKSLEWNILQIWLDFANIKNLQNFETISVSLCWQTQHLNIKQKQCHLIFWNSKHACSSYVFILKWCHREFLVILSSRKCKTFQIVYIGSQKSIKKSKVLIYASLSNKDFIVQITMKIGCSSAGSCPIPIFIQVFSNTILNFNSCQSS